jgi:hypothetical protein
VLIAVAGWMNQHHLQTMITFERRTGFFASNLVVGDCASMTISDED